MPRPTPGALRVFQDSPESHVVHARTVILLQSSWDLATTCNWAYSHTSGWGNLYKATCGDYQWVIDLMSRYVAAT